MPTCKMHSDEINIDSHLIQKLIQEQFPHWTNLELKEIVPGGTDNVMYKLGDDKVVRLPRTKHSALNLEKEYQWLPQLAPLLPLTIPKVLSRGNANTDYPLPWLICEWFAGKSPNADDVLDYHQAAYDLGHFVSAMQKIELKNGPQCNRGQPLKMRDQETRDSIELLRDHYDVNLLTDLWNSALATPMWSQVPVWVHGDLHGGNLLAQNGRVTAVVDFGLMGVGDPACDLMPAWTILTKETRNIFREIVQVDDATWARGRGWALTMGVVAYPYYCVSNPIIAAIAKRTIDEVLS